MIDDFKQGFLNIKIRKWQQNLMTRIIAIGPSLIVSIISGSSGAGRLIIIASVNNNSKKSKESRFQLIDLKFHLF